MTQRFTHICKQIVNAALDIVLSEENSPVNHSTKCKYLFISVRQIDEMIAENILIDDTRCFHSVDSCNAIPSV